MKIWQPLVGLALLFTVVESFTLKATPTSTKEALLKGLDDPKGFNSATKERTTLVAELISENQIASPGSTNSFTPLAVGTWQIVYAPHIYTMGSLLGGSFSPVIYIMKPNGIMTSHAQYNFPVIGSGWLSVSGTYGSQDEDNACRVDFDTAWVRLLSNDDNSDAEPYDSLEAVPPSPWKDVIQALGKIFFIDAVSVFPVSYLDKDTIVFDFELLGTRICARKVGPVR
jgi:hypothetical protein